MQIKVTFEANYRIAANPELKEAIQAYYKSRGTHSSFLVMWGVEMFFEKSEYKHLKDKAIKFFQNLNDKIEDANKLGFVIDTDFDFIEIENE